MQVTNVRNTNINCKTCEIENYKKEAKKKNLTFLGKGRNNDYKRYSFDDCGHVRDIRPSLLKESTPICFTCLESSRLSDAKALQLTIIGKSSDGDTYKTRYKFIECGHQENIYRSSVKNGYARCSKCYEDKFLTEADEAGLILIGLGKNGNYRTYKFKRCEHEQQIQLIHVRNKNFVCNICTETSRDLPSNIYALKIRVEDKSWIKIGYAKNVQARINWYGLPSSAEIDIVKTIAFESGKTAHHIEESLKAKTFHSRLDPEKMRKYHRWSGHTECYPSEMLNYFQDEFEKISKVQ